jgi:hypothetical protein
VVVTYPQAHPLVLERKAERITSSSRWTVNPDGDAMGFNSPVCEHREADRRRTAT